MNNVTLYLQKILSKKYHTDTFSLNKNNQNFGIAMLLNHQSVYYAIFTLTTFFLNNHSYFPVTLYSDGSLTPKDKAEILEIFPFIKFIDLIKLPKKYEQYKNLTFLRKKSDIYPYIKKIDILIHSSYKNTIYMDSDILFFKNLNLPKTENGMLTKRYAIQYSKTAIENYNPILQFRYLLNQLLPVKINPFFNSGFFIFQKITKRDFWLLEKMAAYLCHSYSYVFNFSEIGLVTEETLLSILFNNKTATFLSEKKFKTILEPIEYSTKLKNELSAIHYAKNTKKFLLADWFLRYYL